MSLRTDRVAEVLRHEISEVIRLEVRDPRVGLSTVTEVAVSPDLRHAVVRLSVLGEDSARSEALEALRHAAGFVKSRLARRVRHLRYIPNLVFELDRGAEHANQIDKLLESLNEEDHRP